jgi:hypothetical protein
MLEWQLDAMRQTLANHPGLTPQDRAVKTAQACYFQAFIDARRQGLPRRPGAIDPSIDQSIRDATTRATIPAGPGTPPPPSVTTPPPSGPSDDNDDPDVDDPRFNDPATGRPCVQPGERRAIEGQDGFINYEWDFVNSCDRSFTVTVYKINVDPNNHSVIQGTGILPRSTTTMNCTYTPSSPRTSCRGHRRDFELRTSGP